MLIIDQLNQQILEEYKSGNSEKRVILQTIKAALQKKQIDTGDKYDSATEITVLKGELKQRQEAREQFASAGRNDLVKKADIEIDTLKQMADDLSNQEIADKLFISLNTVKTHAKNIFLKLGVDSRKQAVNKAKELGII